MAKENRILFVASGTYEKFGIKNYFDINVLARSVFEVSRFIKQQYGDKVAKLTISAKECFCIEGE